MALPTIWDRAVFRLNIAPSDTPQRIQALNLQPTRIVGFTRQAWGLKNSQDFGEFCFELTKQGARALIESERAAVAQHCAQRTQTIPCLPTGGRGTTRLLVPHTLQWKATESVATWVATWNKTQRALEEGVTLFLPDQYPVGIRDIIVIVPPNRR